MIKQFTISDIKEYLTKTKEPILPVMIIGKITELKNTIIIQDKQYFSFNLADNKDYITLAILKSDNSKKKITFIMDKYRSREKIVIKEPRRPNIQLQSFNIDLLISELDPSIGTEIIEYSVFKSFSDFQFNPKPKINVIKEPKIKGNLETKTTSYSFSTASDLLKENSKNVKSENTSHETESVNNISENIQLLKDCIVDIDIIDKNFFKKDFFNKISYIVSVEDNNNFFLAKITFLGDDSKNKRLIKILEFKITKKTAYLIIKNNIAFFNSIKAINEFLENLGAIKQ